MKSLFNGLLEFPTHNDLEKSLDSMDKEFAIKIIDLALNYIQQNGGFSLEESHCIYKCLNKIKENES